MNFDEAINAFDQLIKNVAEIDKAKFLAWIQRRYFVRECSGPEYAEKVDKLNEIAKSIRERLPFSAVLSSEEIFTPKIGENADCQPDKTLHIDSFLYDDSDVDELCEEEKLSRNYCVKCGSHDVKPLNFISHSSSRKTVEFIFNSLIPFEETQDKLIVDVGSRLGALLYGACIFTEARSIIGVEINSEFCQLQRDIINEHGFEDRIQVIEADILEEADVLSDADVVLLNNPFEFFVDDEEKQRKMWTFIRETVKPGAIIVATPPLEQTFATYKVNIDIRSWVERRYVTDPLDYQFMLEAEDIDDIAMYRVIK